MAELLLSSSETSAGHALAKQALEVLNASYPGYSWAVRVDQNIMYIQACAIGRVGMCRHLNQMDYDAMVMRRDVVMAAGELLERAHLKRGKSAGERVNVLEGGEEFGWKPSVH